MAIWDQLGSGSNSSFGGTPFFNSGSTYGAGQSYYDSPISENIREQNLPIAFSSYLTRQGVGDTDQGFNRWVYSQFPRFQRGYGLATLENPFLGIDQFLATLPTAQGLYAQFQALDPASRGISARNYAPVSRWITR